jgi:uncharacterized protein
MAAPASRLQVIESYRGNAFRVSGMRHAGSVIVFRERTASWPVAAFDRIDIDALAGALAAAESDPLAGRVELLLLGCGARLIPPPPALRARLKQIGVALEPMDTGAACRTYNVLAAEERRVAAALIAVA